MRILSLNARGLHRRDKHVAIKRIIEALGVDLVLLQETHFNTRADVRRLEKVIPWEGYHSFGGHRSAGVAVLVNPSFRGNVVKYFADAEGRLIAVEVAYDGKLQNIVNVYAPTYYRERNEFSGASRCTSPEDGTLSWAVTSTVYWTRIQTSQGVPSAISHGKRRS